MLNNLFNIYVSEASRTYINHERIEQIKQRTETSSDKWTGLGQLSCVLILNQNIHSRNTLFNHLFRLKKAYYGNECFGLSSLSRFCTISITFLWFWILLHNLEYSHTISNALRRNVYSNLVVGFFSGIGGFSICSNVRRSSQPSIAVFILKTNRIARSFLEHRKF